MEPGKKNKIPGPKKRVRDSEGVDSRPRKRLCKSKGTNSPFAVTLQFHIHRFL